MFIKLYNKWLRLLDIKYEVRIPSRSFEVSRFKTRDPRGLGKTFGLKQERKEADIGPGERRG